MEKKKSARKLEVHICVCKFLPRKLPGAKVTFMQELVLPVQRSYFFFFLLPYTRQTVFTQLNAKQ